MGQARKEPDREYYGKRDLLIASDVPMKKPVDGHIHQKFLSKMTYKGDLPCREIRNALKETQLKTVLAREFVVLAAKPGEELAAKVPPADGDHGRDMFGNTTDRAGKPKDVQLRAGSNVEIVDDKAIAQIFGYVYAMNNIIAVISPVWISPDCLEAHFIHFPHAGPQVVPQAAWIRDLFESLSLVSKPSERTIASLIRNLAVSGKKKRNFLLAQGKASSPGRDSYLEWSIDAEGVEELLMKDGKVDEQALQSSVSVKKGQLVARVISPEPGEPGIDLRGEPIPASSGERVTYESGENVFCEEEDGEPKSFYSKIDGNVHLKDTVISVHSVLRVEGDVDASSGDIVAGNDVEITGSVRDGAKVSAAGSVTILGVVEGGATISAKGDVRVSQGVLGDKTKVIALGSVETRFVRESSIMARVDVTIGDHCHNANVRAGRELIVQSGDSERGGSIIGGQVHATTRIKADTVGSPTSSGTVVGIATDIAVEAKLKKAKKRVEFCDNNILRMLRTLGIQSLDAPIVEMLLKRTPPWRKQAMVELIMKLREIVAFRETSLKKMEDVEKEKEGLLDGAEVEITNKIFADSTIDIGFNKLKMNEDIENAIFSLSRITTSSGVMRRSRKTRRRGGKVLKRTAPIADYGNGSRLERMISGFEIERERSAVAQTSWPSTNTRG